MYGAVRTCVTWRFRTENSVGESETKRAPTYLLNIHIQPTYAATLRTRQRYALRVTWKVIHVKQKAKHCVTAGGTRVREFQMWTMHMYDILGSEG